MFLGLYVDDVLIEFHNEGKLRDVKLKLEERFRIKMLGAVRRFFGIIVHETQKSYFCPNRAWFVTHSTRSILNMSELSRLQWIPTQTIMVLTVKN